MFFNLPLEAEEAISRMLASCFSGVDANLTELKKSSMNRLRCKACGQFISKEYAYVTVSLFGIVHIKKKCLLKAFKKLPENFFKKEKEQNSDFAI